MNSLDIFKNLSIKSAGKLKKSTADGGAVIYTRVSTDKQAKNNHSLETQARRCENYCIQKQIRILQTFGGTHESAKTDDRKEFNKMLDYIRNTNKKGAEYKVQYVIVTSIDRFSRSGSAALQIIEELKKIGVRVVCLDNQYDTETSHGKFFQGMSVMFSELENNTRKEKILVGIREMLLKGAWPTKSPLGYDKIPDETNRYKKSVINDKGKLIKTAFRLKLEGQSNTFIQEWLEVRGLKLHRQKLTEIFKNPFYCGVIKHSILGEDEAVRGTQEKMITEEEFIKINDLSFKHLKTHKTDDDYFPLKSTIICDKCLCKLTAYHIRQKNAKYYKCNTKGCNVNINTKKTHNMFEEYLNSNQINPMHIGPLKQQLAYTFEYLNQSQKKDAGELYKLIKKNRDEMEIIDERLAIGEIDRPLHEKVIKKKTLELLNLEEAYKKVNRKLSNLDNYIETSLKLCSNLSSIWIKGTLSIKQRLQNLLFPNGIRFNKDLGTYLTEERNAFFSLITSISEDFKRVIDGQISPKTDLSYLVVPTRIELISKV